MSSFFTNSATSLSNDLSIFTIAIEDTALLIFFVQFYLKKGGLRNRVLDKTLHKEYWKSRVSIDPAICLGSIILTFTFRTFCLIE